MTAQNVMTPFRTTYALTTHDRMARGAKPIPNRHERKHQAIAHAQQAANALGVPVILVERDAGLPDYHTIIKPQR
jgi:hypothetical protein